MIGRLTMRGSEPGPLRFFFMGSLSRAGSLRLGR